MPIVQSRPNMNKMPIIILRSNKKNKFNYLQYIQESKLGQQFERNTHTDRIHSIDGRDSNTVIIKY